MLFLAIIHYFRSLNRYLLLTFNINLKFSWLYTVVIMFFVFYCTNWPINGCLRHLWMQEEFLDSLYWTRQIVSALLGLLWGIIPLRGLIGLALYAYVHRSSRFKQHYSFDTRKHTSACLAGTHSALSAGVSCTRAGGSRPRPSCCSAASAAKCCARRLAARSACSSSSGCSRSPLCTRPHRFSRLSELSCIFLFLSCCGLCFFHFPVRVFFFVHALYSMVLAAKTH